MSVFGKEFYANKPYFLLTVVGAKLGESLFYVIALALTEVVADFFFFFRVENLVDEIFDVHFIAGIHNSLYIVEQLVELKTVERRNLTQVHLAVDAFNDRNLKISGHRHFAHPQVLRTLDFVLVHISLDDFYKLLSITFGFSCAHAGDILQLLDRHR